MDIDKKLAKQIMERIKEGAKTGKRLAFAYDRISSELQTDGISLEYQEEHAAKYAKENDLFIVHFFTVVESARKEYDWTFPMRRM